VSSRHSLRSTPLGSSEPSATSTEDALDQLDGITGLGWTAALIGYLVSLIDLGGSVLTEVVPDTASLLSLGGVLFAPTLGLDRLNRSAAESDE
jgi:hypothetical protein